MPVAKIVDKFGGPAALARLIGKGHSTVAYWQRVGTIPAKWQPVLIKLAQRNAIDLTAADFIPLSLEPLKPLKPLKSAEKAPDGVPTATHWGETPLGEVHLPSYVLDNGMRVFGLNGVVAGLVGTEGGLLGEYLKVRALRDFLPEELKPAEDGSIPALCRFDTGGKGNSKYAIGLPVERFIDLCSAYGLALQEHLNPASQFQLTARQIEIAKRAIAFERACAKVGIIALVDEATGYQYDREQDVLRLKLNLLLGEEMRKWERTFPEQLWIEFARLTKWTGPVHSRPKYWGKLVNELIYECLDPDVVTWLKENAPKPMNGQSYHQWIQSQFGLKKLMEHIWTVVGMAAACTTMPGLREMMAERYGRVPVQLRFYLDPSKGRATH